MNGSSIGIIGGADGPTAIFVSTMSSFYRERLLFALVLAVFLVHELDAVRAREWEMMPILKNMPENKAANTFILLHLPLFALAFGFLLPAWGMAAWVGKLVIDVFLLVHVVLHLALRKHAENRFSSRFSKIFICLPGALALVHAGLVFGGALWV